MQRWIAFGLVAMVLMMAGASYGEWEYRQSRPVPMWVPLPLNSELSEARRKEIVTQLKTELARHDRLEKISTDMNLAKEWSLPSPDAAADQLAKRIFVKLGDMETPMGRVDAIHVGLKGTRRDKELSGKISMRLKDEVWDILGITPPKQK